MATLRVPRARILECLCLPLLMAVAGCGRQPSAPAVSGTAKDPPVTDSKPAPAGGQADDKKPAEELWSGKTISQWIAQLKSADDQAQWEATLTLAHIGPPAAGAIPSLQEAIKKGPANVKSGALQALASVDATELPVFGKLLTEKAEPEFVRRMAVQALAQYLKPENRRLEGGRRQDVRAIDSPYIDPKAAAAARLLAGLLKEESVDLRLSAAETLGQLGHEAAGAEGALGELLKDENPKLRTAALYALIRMGPPAAAAVAPAVVSKDELFRFSAVNHITNSASKTSGLVAAMLTDKDEAVRVWAARWLNKNGEIIRNAQRDRGVLNHDGVKIMLEALKDKNDDVRWNIAEAFGKIGTRETPKEPIIAALTEARKDNQELVRQAASEALKKFDGQSKK